jgi:hypothetical protein
MPCQCGTTATVASDAEITSGTCECATQSAGGCECGSGTPPPPGREHSLERVVMDLDQRVRKLEANR